MLDVRCSCCHFFRRITFQLREEHKAVVAEKMGWSNSQLDMYYQAALDMIPVARSIQTPELYYTKLIDAITSDDGDSTKKRNALLLNKGKDNEHRTSVVVDTIAETTLAMYNNAVRWTSAFLLRDGVRPNNLDVLAEHAVEKVTFAIDGDNLRATGVIVQHEETRKPTEILIERDGEVAVTAGAIGSVAVLQRSGVGPSEVLEPLGIKTIIDNNEVGHGVDHAEIAVMYEWLDKWNDPVTKQLPEGGVMGWPLVIFASFLPEDIFSKDETPTNNSDLKPFMAAHFGAGFAEPYTDFPSVVGTPSCVQPDQSAGYHAKIVSKDPFESLLVVHKDQAQDLVKMARGVCRMISIFEVLKAKGFVGERLEPSFPITIENRTRLLEWIKNNHYTVFHWALTCRSGKDGPVVDEFFRVRRSTAGSNAVVDNLRVGSAASLPDIPEANPHLSISAFSFALAESMVKTIAIRKKVNYTNPLELQNAANNVYKNMLDRKDDIVAIRRPGEETPKLGEVAEKHAIEWDLLHPDTEN